MIAAFALVTVAPGPAYLAVPLTAAGQGAGPSLRMAPGLALGPAFRGVLSALGPAGAELIRQGPTR